MRPARTTKKANPVSGGKGTTTGTSSQGRRDAGAVVSKYSISKASQGHFHPRLDFCFPHSHTPIRTSSTNTTRLILQKSVEKAWRPLPIELSLLLQIRTCCGNLFSP